MDKLKFDFDELKEVFRSGDENKIQDFLNKWNLEIRDGKVIVKDSDKEEWEEVCDYWDKRQYIRKINLNSAYGCLLNKHSRFHDHRIGQSTTLTGRTITKHMTSKINDLVTGKYDHNGKSIIYGDTDSTYFSIYPILKNKIESGEVHISKENFIQMYDRLADEVNETFSDFLLETLNLPINRSQEVIKAGREVVALSGLFIKKKRYSLMVYDQEGIRTDVDKPGKMKVTGLEIKRSDTPKFVQEFLSDVLQDVLLEKDEDYILKKIREFKKEFDKLDSWKKGTPTSANKINYYKNEIKNRESRQLKGLNVKKGFTVPGHVAASINWNQLRDLNKDKHSMEIFDGQKVIVCKLKDHPLYDSIAYPTDETRLPEWFKELPFDDDVMREKIIDKKISNLLGILKWDFSKTDKKAETFENMFTFE